MIITVGGPPGSGKSTAAAYLSDRLGIRAVSAGRIFRGMARERRLSLAEFGELAETHWEIDRELDERMLAEAHGDVVLEARLSGPLSVAKGINAFRVYISARREVRAARIGGREHKDPAQALREMEERERSEALRYSEIYGMDIWDTSIYDLVIDSSDITAEQVVDRIVEGLGRSG